MFSNVLRQITATRKLNSMGILQLEIALDHLTNLGSTVNGTA